MEIEIQQEPGNVRVVRVRGELTGRDSDSIQKTLHPLIAARDAAMVVDLAGLDSVDSGGLSQLISLTTHARLSQSRVILVGPKPFVAGVLKMTKLDGWFEMAEDVAAARQMLGQGG